MNIELKNSEGLAALQLGDYETALKIFEDCLTYDPSSPILLYNKGLTLFRTDKFREAEHCFKEATVFDNKYTEAWAMLGAARIEQRKFYTAMPALYAANTTECEALAGQIMLGQGYYPTGFGQFEKRHKVPNTWDGLESLVGKTLLIEGTEGLGDQVFFARWLSRVNELGADQVYIKVHEALIELFDWEFELGRMHVLRADEETPQTDHRINLGSLGAIFYCSAGTLPVAPYFVSWGCCNYTDVKNIGLAWSGNIMHLNDRKRSIPLPFFQPILDLNYNFTCAQKDVRAGDEDYMQHTKINKAEIENVEVLARAIADQDLIITVDTLTANLAGAMGIPTIVLVPYVCDWRWGFEGERTPWYPTVRVLRQGEDRRWEPVIDRVMDKLKAYGTTIQS